VARLVWLCLLLVPVLAHAEGSQDARAHFNNGNAHFAVGEFEQAAIEYQEAYKLKQDPALLYNAAQAYRLAGNSQKALVLYKNYIVFYPGQKNIPEVKKQIAMLEEAINTNERAKTAPPINTALPNEDKTPKPRPQPAPPPPTETKVATAPKPIPKPEPKPEPPKTATRVEPAPQPPPPQPEPQPEPQPPPKKVVSDVPTPQPPVEKPTPIYKKWWLWTAVAAVVVVAVVVPVAVVESSTTRPWQTANDFGPGTRSALVSW